MNYFIYYRIIIYLEMDSTFQDESMPEYLFQKKVIGDIWFKKTNSKYSHTFRPLLTGLAIRLARKIKRPFFLCEVAPYSFAQLILPGFRICIP